MNYSFKKKWLLIHCIVIGVPCWSQALIYPFPVGITSSSVYQVSVANQKVFVYDAPVAPVSSFDLLGPVDVLIKADREVRWIDVRPRNLGINAEFRDSTIILHLEKPCKLSLELNGESSNKPLYLFANPPEQNKIKKTDPGVHYFEAGKVYTPGRIVLKKGETVYIEGGAVVYGFITGEEVNDIRILGRGILEGSRNRELRGDTRFHFIDLKDCNNIHIEGISLINGLTWQVAPVHCNDLLIENIKIISNNGSDDGIDLVRTNHVLIDGCFIHTKDDCMAIKSAWDYPGSEGNRDILVKNSVFWNTEWGNALEIGFELRADTMENITFRNCDVIHCDDGAVFSIHNADRSLVQNVLFEDIRVEDAHQKLFDLAIFLSQYSIDGPSDPMERQARYQNGAWDGTVHLTAAEKKEHAAFRGQIKNITFRNISVTDGIFPFSVFSGYDEAHIIENILIENLEVHGKKIDQEYKARISRQYCKGLVIR